MELHLSINGILREYGLKSLYTDEEIRVAIESKAQFYQTEFKEAEFCVRMTEKLFRRQGTSRLNIQDFEKFTFKVKMKNTWGATEQWLAEVVYVGLNDEGTRSEMYYGLDAVLEDALDLTKPAALDFFEKNMDKENWEEWKLKGLFDKPKRTNGINNLIADRLRLMYRQVEEEEGLQEMQKKLETVFRNSYRAELNKKN